MGAPTVGMHGGSTAAVAARPVAPPQAPAPPAPPTAPTAATVLGRLETVLASRGGLPSLRWQEAGCWHDLSWRSYVDAACAFAGGLQALGVRRGDRVALLLENRPELHVADLGALLAGAVPVSLYLSLPPARLRYLLDHSHATVAVASARELPRLEGVRDDLSGLRHIVTVDGDAWSGRAGDVPFARVAGSRRVDLGAAVAAVRPDDLATLIYTSGTTGPPKGVRITHRNVVAAIDGLIGALGHGVAGARMVSFLPMAHIAERVASYYVHLAEGTDVTTCPDPSGIGALLPDVRPELFFAVPRVWEKAVATVRSLARLGPDGGRSFEEALAVALEVLAATDAGRRPSPELAARRREADHVLAPVRVLMGLDRCRVAVSTGAPIDPGVLDVLRALRIPISEVYGLSEVTGALTWDPRHPRRGDVGRPVPGAEVRVAADGEVLARGPMVFDGYLDDPAATAAAIDADGWLHTGDLGVLTRGRLRIVGREKDLLVTAGGENVAPGPIESSLRGHPLVAEAFVAGDRRPYLVALVTVDAEVGVGGAAGDTAAGGVREEIERWVARVNAERPRHEHVRRVAVLDHPWTVDSDELTPTMKVRRQAVLDKFAEEIDSLYR